MKKPLITLLTFTFLILMSSNVLAAKTVSCFVNTTNGDYVYTANAEEYSVLAAHPAFKGIGPVWVAPENGTPVYRLWNPANGIHHYTSDPNEVHVLCVQYGWYSDFNGAPAFYSGGPTPIKRYYDPTSGAHRFTMEFHWIYQWGQYLVYEGEAMRGYEFDMRKDYSGI